MMHVWWGVVITADRMTAGRINGVLAASHAVAAILCQDSPSCQASQIRGGKTTGRHKTIRQTYS